MSRPDSRAESREGRPKTAHVFVWSLAEQKALSAPSRHFICPSCVSYALFDEEVGGLLLYMLLVLHLYSHITSKTYTHSTTTTASYILGYDQLEV